jgi:hypothetical protein
MKCIITLMLALISSVCASSETFKISPYGYGPVKIGMTVTQVEKVLKTKLISDGSEPDSECYHVHTASGHKDVLFMIEAKKVARVSIYGGPNSIRTVKGIAIGDSEKKLLLAYGGSLEITPHNYGESTDKYMTHWTKDKKFGIRYEIIRKSVDIIHGGSSAIRYVEGCS